MIDAQAQQRAFDHFQTLTTYAQRTNYLRSIVRRPDTVLPQRPGIRKRSTPCVYYLADAAGVEQQVCGTFMASILQVGRQRLLGATASASVNPTGQDRRGKHRRLKDYTKRPDDEETAAIVRFVDKVPQYEIGHNATKARHKRFHPRLKLKMLYEAWQQHTHRSTKYKFFIRMVHRYFEHVKVWRKARGKCRMCAAKEQRNKPNGTAVDDAGRDDHQSRRRHEAIVDKSRCRFDQSVEKAQAQLAAVLAFELQRPLEMPYGADMDSFAWPQLWFSNVCVSDEAHNKSYMYTWDESQAKRRPDEIGSCLYRHLFTMVRPNTRRIVLYSDAADIYRNMRLTLMLKKVFDYWPNEHLQTIEQRFFVAGHNFAQCRRSIVAIEADSVRRSFFGPDDWVRLVSGEQRRAKEIHVTRMQLNEFYSASGLMSLVGDAGTVASGETVDWRSITSLTYRRSEPMRLSFCIDAEQFDYALSDRDANEFHGMRLAYSSLKGNAISRQKFQGLCGILPQIPAKYHGFYRNLRFKNNCSDDDDDYALVMNDADMSSGDEEASDQEM